MKTIPLQPIEQGLFAQVSDEDWPRVHGIEWCAYQSTSTWYAMGHVPKLGTVLLHRFILNAPPGTVVDHIDHNGLNCQRDNLRLATRSQNMANRRRSKGALYRGVRAESGKFRALIRCNRKRHNLGLFVDAVAAAEAYDRKAVELFGEFAMTNAKLEALGEVQFPPRKIRLLDGSTVTVSHQDYARVSAHDWVGVPGQRIYTWVRERMVHLGPFITGAKKGTTIEHINGDVTDFQRDNLLIKEVYRPIQKKLLPTRSGIKGVDKRGSLWRAYIVTGLRNRTYLGSFRTALEAARVYNRAALALHGPKAVLNDLTLLYDGIEYHI